MNNYGVVLFDTNSSAMQAEAVLSRARFVTRLIPTPRELSSDCGISLRFDLSQIDEVRALLTKAHVDVAGIHPLPGK